MHGPMDVKFIKVIKLLTSYARFQGFRREVDENCATLGYQAACNSNLPTFREKPTGCTETSVSNYHYTMRNSPEERSTHTIVLHTRAPKHDHDHGYHKQVC